MSYRDDLEISKGTIHKSKGLEEDIVIILGMDSGMKAFRTTEGRIP